MFSLWLPINLMTMERMSGFGSILFSVFAENRDGFFRSFMDLYHWPSPAGNFGDDLNLWLWDFLLPGFREQDTDTLLVGVGTVLDTALLPAGRRKMVVGSGTGYGKSPDVSDTGKWDIRCVRGPKTAQALGLPAEKGIIDPAAVIPDMPDFQNIRQHGEAVFVPHWESALFGQWDRVCESVGIRYIDSCGESHEVIRQIAGASLVIAESMHAAILADAFRVPWIAVSTSRQINSFKWEDWAASLEVEYTPQWLAMSSPLEAAGKGQPYMGMRWPGGGQLDTPGEEGTSNVEMGSAKRVGFKQRVKNMLSSPLVSRGFLWPAARQLAKVAAMPQSLSQEDVYERQKSRFYEVIGRIREDHEGS